jgi:O-antigen/teichoic acid export membrane protein
MNTIQTIAKNTGALTIMHIVTMGLGLIFTVSLARCFGDVAFGKYSFALAFTALFAVLMDLGFNQLTIREVARDKTLAKKYMGNILIIKLLLSIVFFALIVAAVNLMQYPSDTKTIVYIFGASTVLTSFGGLFRAIFHAFEKMEYDSLLTIIRQIIVVSIGLILLFSGYNLIQVVSVYLIGGIVDIVFSSLVTVKKFATPKFEVNFAFWKRSIISAIPFGIFALFMVVNYRVDTVMLSVMKGDAVVGWYNAAYTLIFALSFIPAVFIGALFPVFSRLSTNSKNSLEVAYEKSFQYLLLVSIPIAVGTTILSDRIITIVYGEIFVNSVIALQILIWAIVPMFVYYALGAIILAIDEEKKAVLMWGLCASVNVILNLILIPTLSYIGASFTTVFSETILFMLFFYFLSKHFHRISIHKILYKPLIVSLLMGMFIFYFKDMNFVILICLAIFIYISLLFITRTFSKEDIRLFKQTFKGEKYDSGYISDPEVKYQNEKLKK